jgi:hypothetical protein
MKTISETAHAQNIQSFEQLVSYLSSHQVAFKSRSKLINDAELKQISNEAKTASQKVDFLTDEYCKALVKRETLFQIVPTIGKSLCSALPNSHIEKSSLENCLKLSKKLSSFHHIPYCHYALKLKKQAGISLKLINLNQSIQKLSKHFPY